MGYGARLVKWPMSSGSVPANSNCGWKQQGQLVRQFLQERTRVPCLTHSHAQTIMRHHRFGKRTQVQADHRLLKPVTHIFLDELQAIRFRRQQR